MKGGVALRYGASNLSEAIYTRRGVPYASTIKSGLGHFNDEWNEKDLTGYLPQLASASELADVEVTLFGCDTPRSEPELLFTETITAPDVEDFIPTFFRNTYFMDRIVAAGGSRVELGARSFQVQSIDTRAVVRG
jgi:hypothetical protein